MTDDQTDEPVPGRTAWFHCGSGVAGDMVLGALIDAAEDPATILDAVRSAADALGIHEVIVDAARVQRCGIGGHHLRLSRATVDHHGDHHPHRRAAEVLAMIEAAALPARARDRAIATYRALAEVEGGIHGLAPEEVELHEVGAWDSIIDVVGTCVALEVLGIDELRCSPIATGHGAIDTAHGRLPNPAPAVVELAARAGAPLIGLDTDLELATPTGMALMTVLSSGFGTLPTMRIRATGFGAGTADPPGRPNLVQVVIGDSDPAGSATLRPPGQPAWLVETNVDDVTGEVLAHTLAALLAAGAHDAWATPIVMKKGRPAHTVHALCDLARFDAVGATLLAETGTLGLRATELHRWPQHRDEDVVDFGGHRVRVKRGANRIKVEHDDAAEVAARTGMALREVIRRVESLAAEPEPPDAR